MKPIDLVKSWCKAVLSESGSADLSIDSPEATIGRWKIIRDKLFLRQIYIEWYQSIAHSISSTDPPALIDLPALEVGSGAGFMSEFVPHLITSDILALPEIDRVIDACKSLPFGDDSLRAIAMVNVFHHLPNCQAFLSEAQRCLAVGGTVSLIEPWPTTWSSFVYSHLHHEPFDPAAPQWSFDSKGPLSGANQALPWIVFSRDRDQFEDQFPRMRVESIELIMPIRYLLSGGVSLRALAPFWSYRFWAGLERCFQRQMPRLAMFAHIVLKKVD